MGNARSRGRQAFRRKLDATRAARITANPRPRAFDSARASLVAVVVSAWNGPSITPFPDSKHALIPHLILDRIDQTQRA